MELKRILYAAGLAFSLFSSLLLLATVAFQWSLIELFTPFLWPFVHGVVFLLFIIVLLAGLLLFLFTRIRTPLIVCVAALLMYALFPFTTVILYVDFHRNLADREQVIQQLETKPILIQPDTSGVQAVIPLPLEYKHVSRGGGDVLLDSRSGKVLFFTFRGVVDNFSGFVYSPSGQEPQADDFGGTLREIERMKENWYWVRAD
ncbi:hypothetical protein [Paenibacillus koleovorans]|uniref:hypothetical protein n=1 Tax=Paenibacillus koleovorans TaxID=121608 RepID=UPI000FDB6CE1|nr:hypothetical protein [Paenibacillus koleovorans]